MTPQLAGKGGLLRAGQLRAAGNAVPPAPRASQTSDTATWWWCGPCASTRLRRSPSTTACLPFPPSSRRPLTPRSAVPAPRVVPSGKGGLSGEEGAQLGVMHMGEGQWGSMTFVRDALSNDRDALEQGPWLALPQTLGLVVWRSPCSLLPGGPDRPLCPIAPRPPKRPASTG